MTDEKVRQPALPRALAAAHAAWGADWQPDTVARAPGRLELLGNHVDYNGGPVLAAAIDRDAVCLVRRHKHAKGMELLVADYSDDVLRLEVARLREWQRMEGAPDPADFLRGVVATAIAEGATVPEGAQVVVAGDVPIGFGVSSSAALCVAATLALHEPVPTGRALVLRAQQAENRAGSPCGTMDQSASVGGFVIEYDGSTVSWNALAPDLGPYRFVVADSGVSRSLASSSYPKRVQESRAALLIAREALGRDVPYLAALDERDLDQLTSLSEAELPDSLKRRVRHVVLEVARVRAGLAAMERADWVEFGRLMNASGTSSATDYEISHPRVEKLVGHAREVPGVLGARMMGGGEGGTALVLVHEDAVEALRRLLHERYYGDTRATTSDDPVQVMRFAPGAELLRPHDRGATASR